MLEGKSIIVTGCASGIGAETARQIRHYGGTVIGVDRNAPSGNVDQFIQADLSTKAGVDDLIAALPKGANGLANIAGLPPTAPAADVIKVNLVALKYLTNQIVDTLADGASIVNLASLAGAGWASAVDQIKDASDLDFDGVDEFVERYDIESQQGRSYFFSKEAIVVWTMQNRWTWRDRGIRMNSISPGAVETPILQDFLDTLGKKAEESRKVMDRWGNPGDIAPVAVFLLSDMTGWIRGVNIPVDGGQVANVMCNMNGL
jgi:NAD(P)-dependent dehydrogenase (short-subunit alcohol dehydrogenase family)